MIRKVLLMQTKLSEIRTGMVISRYLRTFLERKSPRPLGRLGLTRYGIQNWVKADFGVRHAF